MSKTKVRTRPERSERMEIRLESAEKDAFQRAADATGTTLSSWIRERLRSAAKRDLEAAGETNPLLTK